MADETLKLVNDRMDRLEHRLKVVEDGFNTDKGRTLIEKIGRAGIVVACFGGILAGADTLLTLYNKVTASPQIELGRGDELDLAWFPDQQLLNLSCDLRLINNGEASGSLKEVTAYVKTGTEGAGPPITPLGFRISEGGARIGLPISVLPNSRRDLKFTITWKLSNEQWQAFFENGLRRLTLEINPYPPENPAYCFYATSSLANELRTNGQLKFTDPDPRCG